MLNAINSIGAVFQNWWALPAMFGCLILFGVIVQIWWNNYLKKKAMKDSDMASVDANQQVGKVNEKMNSDGKDGMNKVQKWLKNKAKKS